MNCLICNEGFNNNRSLSGHIRKHGLSTREYKEKFNLIRRCKKCSNELSKNNKGGYCNHCRDRAGEKNSFFGRTHSEKTRKQLHKSCALATKKMWEDDDYRKKVVENATGLKRDEKFRSEQSERISQWYKDNPIQREIRSKHLKKTWEDGRIEPSINSINESKVEREIMAEIKKLLPSHDVVKKTLKIKKRWLYPDVIIDGKIVIEVNGDYWHANPNRYKDNDIIHHSKTAKEIWTYDKGRIDLLNEAGYSVYVIWQSEYKLGGIDFLKETLKKTNLLLDF